MYSRPRLALVVATVILATAIAWAGSMEKPSRRSQGTNLVTNGTFDAGPPSGGGHGHQVAGAELKGWTVSGKVHLLGEGSDRRVNLGEMGTIEQTIKTVPGQEYMLVFDMSAASAGPAVKTCNVTAGTTRQSFSRDSANATSTWDIQRMAFKATAPKTVLRFSNPVNDYHGPHLGDIEVVAMTPLMSGLIALQPAYRTISAGYQNHDFKSIGTVLAPDFTAKLLDGTTQTRDQFLADAAKLKDRLSLFVDYRALDMEPKGASSIVAHVNRIVSYTVIDKYGARKKHEIVSGLTETWVKTPRDTWLLQSSTETDRTFLIDGVDQAPGDGWK